MSSGRYVERHENHEAQPPWWHLALCAAIGAGVCVVVDIVTKQEASAITMIGNGMRIVLAIQRSTWLAIIVVVAAAVGLCFVFQPKSKKSAFGLGLGILSFIMVTVPGSLPPLPTNSDSTDVYIYLENGPEETFDQVIVKVWDLDKNRPVGQTKYMARDRRLFFVLEDPHIYTVHIEVRGYRALDREIDLQSDPPEIHLSFTLEKSFVPLFLQRLTR